MNKKRIPIERFSIIGVRGIEDYNGIKDSLDLPLWKVTGRDDSAKLRITDKSISIVGYRVLEKPYKDVVDTKCCKMLVGDEWVNALQDSRDKLESELIRIIQNPRFPEADVLVIKGDFDNWNYTTTTHYLTK